MSRLAPLYLLDSYGLIYRSYFAFMSRPLRNSEGQNVSALFGFARTLISLIDEGAPAAGPDGALMPEPRKPLRLAAAFDSRTPTFRHKMYAAYKATRQKTPDDLHAQVPLVEEFLAALGVPVIRSDGYEADDIIATLARRCKDEGRPCYILSSDKDLLQLVGDGVWQLRPRKSGSEQEAAGSIGGLSYSLTGPEDVKREWGVPPARVLDLLSLVGDSSDNVPGVKGIGEKTAAKLMARYGSLEGIYENIAGIEGAVGKKLAEGKEAAFFARTLIALNYEAPLSIEGIDSLSVEALDRTAGAQALMRQGIVQSARALDGRVKKENAGTETAGRDAPEALLLGEGSYRTVTGEEELAALFAKARGQGLLSLDFETDSLDAWNAKPIGISFALQPREAYYAPVAAHAPPAGGAERAPFIDPARVRSLLEDLLSDPKMIVAAHNAKYDYKVSRGWGIPRWKFRIWDTMVAAWVDDPERLNYTLDSLAVTYFNYTPVSY
ncbi:MAG: DNA polymerase I, partial [Treponema sp.]|nr:DNA polymerase I [Treponema sp.]